MTKPSTTAQALSPIPCNLCGSREILVLANRSRSGKPLRTVICPKCGLVRSDPLPHNPREFYEDAYRLSYKGAYAPKPKHIFRAGKVALSRYRKIEQLLKKPLVILDVGSGGGEFSYLLHAKGHTVKGIEPNKGYAEYSILEYGLNVQLGFIQDALLPEADFDLITIWHVLEHTENPCAVLSKLHTLLKPQGILVIEVPNVEAICQSPKSTFHEAHIFNFNTATLQKMTEKVGFSVLEQTLSDDGGNITLIVQKSSPTVIDAHKLQIPGNQTRITRIVQTHTTLTHYFSPHPYKRLLHRIAQALLEKRATTYFVKGKQLLDKLYAPPHKVR